ncbi:MAG TPA: MFS transporter, partial [Burkholderiales bacterium]|nr:MFS transporter [Burkholderiales bacterium]
MAIYTVFAIVICNMSSYRASKILVSLFAIELGASQIAIGAIVAMYSLFPMFMALYAGRLIDRLGMRSPMVFGSAGISLGLLVPFVWPNMTSLYVSAALIGASHVFYNVSIQNLVGYLSGPDSRTRNFSNYGLVMALGSFLGPLAAGFSIDQYGHPTTYLFTAVLPLVALGIIWSL